MQLRKLERPFVRRAQPERRRELEDRLFTGAYKGVTDLVTKWVWPRPARWVTGLCVTAGLRPNHVTLVGLAMVVLAGLAFAYGERGWGLAAAWLMTFLDTVDGKLARVTVTSSRSGHVLDHGVDLIHPPLWYIAWGLGLASFAPGWPDLSLGLTRCGDRGRLRDRDGSSRGRSTSSRRSRSSSGAGFDSYARLITARRNPNLIWLTAGMLLGRPDLGLVAVAAWTALSSVALLVRLAMAARRRHASGPLRSWLVDANQDRRPITVDPHLRDLGRRLMAAVTPGRRSLAGGPGHRPPAAARRAPRQPAQRRQPPPPWRGTRVLDAHAELRRHVVEITRPTSPGRSRILRGTGSTSSRSTAAMARCRP